MEESFGKDLLKAKILVQPFPSRGHPCLVWFTRSACAAKFTVESCSITTWFSFRLYDFTSTNDCVVFAFLAEDKRPGCSFKNTYRVSRLCVYWYDTNRIVSAENSPSTAIANDWPRKLLESREAIRAIFLGPLLYIIIFKGWGKEINSFHVPGTHATCGFDERKWKPEVVLRAMKKHPGYLKPGWRPK